MLLHDAFFTTARHRGDEVAIVDGARRVTYDELRAMALAISARLHEGGVARGDRVLLFLENTVEFAAAVHGVLAHGAVMVPVSPLAKAERLVFIGRDTRATGLLTQSSLAPVWQAALPVLSSLRLVCVTSPAPAVDDQRLAAWPTPLGMQGEPEVAASEEDLAALIYTSGSTGRPKGVMLTHRNMCSAWAAVQAYLALRHDDVLGLALSPAFSYGLYNLLMPLGLGGTVVLERQAAFPARLLETLARERVTVLPGVPTLFGALLDALATREVDLSALRLITNAAAPLPAAHLQRLRQRLPRATLFSMYGMTECKRISYLPPEELDRRPDSVGRGIAGQRHWLVDEHGARLPDGAMGELVVQGPHVMQGYWERPDETRERLRPGPTAGERVLHTGDLFRSDAEGYLYFVARLDDIIKTRGEKVAPREVEDVIYRLPGVRSCAVVGVPDEALGQAVKAFVVLAEGSQLEPRDVVRHCMAHLESYMAPKQVEFVAELPRTESGKIRHASLRGSAPAA